MGHLSTVTLLVSFKEHPLLCLPLLFVAYLVVRTFYRLYLDPLHHIPGPKIAAASHIYEFYYDVILDGMYIWEIEKLHEKYGPVVRINPREVHIKDPYFYDELYAPTTGIRDKDPHSVEIFSSPGSTVATVDHHRHRLRRKLLNPFFSRRSIERIEPMLRESLDKFLNSLVVAHKENTVLELIDRLQGLTGDVITQYAYGSNYHLQDSKNIGRGIVKVVQEGTDIIHFHRFFPPFGRLLRSIPSFFMARVFPARLAVYELLDGVKESSLEALRQNDMYIPVEKRTMFHALTGPDAPPEEKTLERLQDEGLVLFAAGTETTATALSVAIFYLLNDKSVHQKLRNELDQIMPTPTARPTWRELEKLPYLHAVIHEALRFSGICMRQQRISPKDVLRYKDCPIPPGTPVSMISRFIHMDPTIFPDPEKFYPERWILAAERNEGLSRFLLTFGKGNRGCVGMNLAYAELYNTLAAVVRRFDLELYETNLDSIRFVRDKLLPRAKEGPWAVRVKVVGIREE
ncbi:hypothetical protein FQN54_009499 [Arachnomyces sp. PD_36]|nr:hypothetical protein FQN54_009499 [Arachnomyces sp. PD_36]